MSALTQQQLAFFREEGYLLVDQAIDRVVFQPLRAELADGIDAFARAALADGRLSDAHEDEPFKRRLHLLASQLDDPDPLLAVGRGKLRTPGMFQIYTCSALLDMVESVIGPEILAHPRSDRLNSFLENDFSISLVSRTNSCSHEPPPADSAWVTTVVSHSGHTRFSQTFISPAPRCDQA